jgi:hypothetical protein
LGEVGWYDEHPEKVCYPLATIISKPGRIVKKTPEKNSLVSFDAQAGVYPKTAIASKDGIKRRGAYRPIP